MLIVAHRGLSSRYPQNCAPAFEEALRHEPDAIELDVRQTSDGVLVIHHDRRIRYQGTFASRSGLGEFGAPVRDVTYPVLRQLIPHICRLQDALELIGDRCDILVEVKDHDIAESVYFMCRSMVNRFVIISFYESVIAKVHELAPQCRTGLISSGSSVNNYERSRELGCMVSVQDFEFIEESSMAPFVAAGIPVFAFTVNVAADAVQALEMGIRAIITDRCDVAREWCQ